MALEPEMINVMHDLNHRVSVCTWIGEHIDAVNLQLEVYLQACQDCFHSWEQPVTQIFSAPLAHAFGVDGICNFQTHPITLLVDVGRVQPQDWPLLVAHEYAHAHAGSPGHHPQFARSLSHLCLGLGIAPPPEQWGEQSSMADYLRLYPYCPPTKDPLAFWCGI